MIQKLYTNSYLSKILKKTVKICGIRGNQLNNNNSTKQLKKVKTDEVCLTSLKQKTLNTFVYLGREVKIYANKRLIQFPSSYSVLFYTYDLIKCQTINVL